MKFNYNKSYNNNKFLKKIQIIITCFNKCMIFKNNKYKKIRKLIIQVLNSIQINGI